VTRLPTYVLLASGLACVGLACGCYADEMTIPALSRRLKAGFLKNHPRLFRDWPAIAKLVTRLGYDVREFCYYTEARSAGRRLYLWNQTRSKALLLREDGPPKVIATKKGAFIDDGGNVMAWCTGDEISFASGQKIRGSNITFDCSGTYFATVGYSYDLCGKRSIQTPIEVRAVRTPGKALVTTEVKGWPRAVAVVKGRLCLIVSLFPEEGKRGPTTFGVEFYRHARKGIDLDRRSHITSPSWGRWRITLKGIDVTCGDVLFVAEHDMPTLGPVYYLYNLHTQKMERLGRLRNVVGFLSPRVFRGSLAALERPLDRKPGEPGREPDSEQASGTDRRKGPQ